MNNIKITKIESTKSTIVNERKLKVAAYCRVSSSHDSQLQSLDTQISHYKDYIKSNEQWEYVGVYYDEGISGTKKEKRLGLLELIKDAKAGKINLILTKSISRFARNTSDCLELVRKLISYNVNIYFESENITINSNDEEFMLSVLSQFAEIEARSVADNLNWSIKNRYENGTYIIAYPPYGYKNSNGEMLINDDQAKIVQNIFAEFISGKSTEKIAKALNEQGIVTKRNKKWTSVTILGMLKNEKYVGDIYYQKSYTDSNYKRHTNNGEKGMYYVKDNHKAIISREDFELASKIIEQRSFAKNIVSKTDKYQSRYAFSGKIICNNCGDTFRRRTHNSGNKYVAWCCNTHLKEVSKCEMKYIKDEDIKQSFVILINKLIFGKNEILISLHSRLQQLKKSDYDEEIQIIDGLIAENVEQQKILTSLFAKKYLEPKVYVKGNNDLINESSELNRRKNSFLNLKEHEIEYLKGLNDLIVFTNKTKIFIDFDDEVFIRFVERVVVYSRTEIAFKLKCGLELKERIEY